MTPIMTAGFKSRSVMMSGRELALEIAGYMRWPHPMLTIPLGCIPLALGQRQSASQKPYRVSVAKRALLTQLRWNHGRPT